MKLTEENYYSTKANMEYMSVSQFKAFLDCEASGLAQCRGEWERPKSKAFLEGGYVDAHFSGSMDRFLMEHNEILNSRTGALKAEYAKARAAIEAAEHDEFFREHLEGAHQVIVTGTLFGIKWRGKLDVLRDDMIVDFKYMKDMLPIFHKGERKPFIDVYGYDIQGYVYQQLTEQTFGKHLPFNLAVMTKEDPSDRALINIPDDRLNAAEGVIKYYSKRFDALKRGEDEPVRCEHCAYCRATKKTTGFMSYYDLFE